MQLVININNSYIDDYFIRWLIQQKIRYYILKNIDWKQIRFYEDYLTNNLSKNGKFISLQRFVYLASNSIVYTKVKNSYIVEYKVVGDLYNTDFTYNDILSIISYGSLDLPAYTVFVDAFNDTRIHSVEYLREYIDK